MEVIPAIDLRRGFVVRLAQGDYARQTSYAKEPLLLAHEYALAGANWLHVVDLDGALHGTLDNMRIISGIATSSLRVQAGGGVRGEDDLKRLYDAGVERVVVGSMAVNAPDKVEKWISTYGAERICIALDTRRHDDGQWTLPVHGWTKSAGVTLDVLGPRYAAAGAKHLLCTDIARDGMLSGPNRELYAHVRNIAPSLALQASGGVRDVADVQALRADGLSGVILGRSLLEGRLTLSEALQC